MNTYPAADVVMQSTRTEVLDLAEFREHPFSGRLPAIAAGQLGGWNQDFIMSDQGLIAALTPLTDVPAAAEKVDA